MNKKQLDDATAKTTLEHNNNTGQISVPTGNTGAGDKLVKASDIANTSTKPPNTLKITPKVFISYKSKE